MEQFKFQLPKKIERVRPLKLNVTVSLEGKLLSDFQDYVEKCQKYCKVNNAEVVRQMMEFAIRNLGDIPVDVADAVDGTTHQENFAISTQPGHV